MSRSLIVDPALGRWWAARIEQEVGHWWLIVWATHGQHFAAFYRGHWDKQGGVCRTGRTPHELWARMREVQQEGRRQAMAAHVTVPPVLSEQLPESLLSRAGQP
ncbi:hypothetical protein [Nonomuraea salmonea]|uniref:DUF4913 domain-containing protein n=1 Tax=Nonomuraea salmonea TaxID=46181 RepID=A0ABV5NPJ1_9ACTN